MANKQKVLFITGTRADFGKLKPLMHAVCNDDAFECVIFVTGMHLMTKYGQTYREVIKEGFQDVYLHVNQIDGETMDLILANTVSGLSRFVAESKPDMIVVHGDRLEALAGAIVGAFRNILVCHIEGGERSGTVDDMIRHSVTKLSHVHCVANKEAANRLYQLGEHHESVFITGSPDIDIMLSEGLPSLETLCERYEMPHNRYGIVLYHPVTTDSQATVAKHANALVDALLESDRQYVVIYPNNDEHSQEIFKAYKRLEDLPDFKFYPSLRFEFFLTLLKEAQFIIGNSSAGMREAPVYCVPTVNLGLRQNNRFSCPSILSIQEEKQAIIDAMNKAAGMDDCEQCLFFGRGNSTELFLEMLKNETVWNISAQKKFIDMPPVAP